MKIDDYLSKYPLDFINIVGPMLKQQLNLEGPIIYVDGGANFRKKKEGFSLGDNDSSHSKLDLCLPPDNNYSDLSFALKHCKRFHQLELHGFLDGRKDHEIINFGEVHHHLKNETGQQVNFEKKVCAYSHGEWEIKYKGLFSIFCFEETKLSILGKIKYPLKDHSIKPFSSYGLSNISEGDFSIKADGPVFIFFTEEL